MSPAFNLADYEPVEDRLRAFWEDHPMGRVSTKLEHVGPDGYIVFAAIWRDVNEPQPASTGLASEAVTEKGVNSTSALENCETSAIGRALANLGYAAKGKRPSREEMSKANVSPAAKAGERSEGVAAMGKGPAPSDTPSDGQAQGVVAGSVDAPQHPSEDSPTAGTSASPPSQDEPEVSGRGASKPVCSVNGPQHKPDPERTAKAVKGFVVCLCGVAAPAAEAAAEWAAVVRLSA